VTMGQPPHVFTCTTHQPLPVRSGKGDFYCFNCVVEEHQSQAYNLAGRILGDWNLAEDALQEAFLSAYRAFSSFRGGNLRGWLMRIVSNACLDMLRARKARPSVSLEETLEAVGADFTISPEQSPEEQALTGELGKVIQDGLKGLPEEQRLAVVLVDIQGYSYEEAADISGVSLGTIKSRISRARAALRDFLRQHGELLPSQFRQSK